MSRIKALKIEAIKGWINKLTTMAPGNYKLAPYNGDELERLTMKEIDMLGAFIVSAYSTGCSDTREHIKRLRESS